MRILAAVALLTLAASLASAASLTPTQLRCENLTDPLGIDAAHPRLSWVLQATPPSQRGQAQTGYQILVASDASLLAHDRGDLWDSGKVASDQSTHVAYAGRPLASYARCYWKVRAWDRAGKPSSWSAPALFTIGVLRPEDWQARWITYNQPAGETIPLGDEGKSLDFTGAQWIWYPEGDPHTEVPGGSRYFRHALDVPADKPVATAQMLFTVDDYWILYVNGQEIARSKPGAEQWRQAPQVDLAKFLIAGRNVIAVEGINAAPSPAGFVGKLLVRFADGAEQKLVTDASWKAAKSKEPGWETVKFDASAWAQAMDLGAMGAGPWGAIQTGGTAAWAENRSSPILRKTFRVAKTLREATVSVCGLGFYELRLNGAKVGDRTLDTPFTRYDKRALYATYDITSLLKPGDNALGVMLGNGWYNQFSRDAWDFQNARWRDRPKLLLQVRLVFADGTTRIIGSDSTWQGNTGPVIRDDVRNGEVYDARRELPGWDTAAYDASKWPAAQPAAAPKGVLRAEMMPPVRVMATLTPVALKQTKPGVWVFDMGQAFAGRAQLRVSGPAGTRVVLKYGERLRADGSLEQAQIAGLVFESPFQTEVYILKGQGREEWESRFCYHGYRYVEVTGLPASPTTDTLRGRVMHTAFTPAGSFECSNALLSDIQRLTGWSYRSNFLGFPTDCPHREKNGWTGDAQLACEQAMYNWDNLPAYEKWMNDFQDEQPPSGEFPGIVPTGGWGYGTGPAWDSAYVLIPWYLYQYTGDSTALQQQFPGMKRYVDFLQTRQRGQIVDYGLGDWVCPKTQTQTAITSTGYYYVDARILAQTAALLGNAADADKYNALADRIREAFRAKFLKADGTVDNGSITAQSCALYQGLLDDRVGQASRLPAVDRLVAEITKQGNTWDCGILGAKYVLNALTENGRVEDAYRLATQTTAPSYGYWLKQGATTLWEDWYGGASLNHIMFGDISAWFYKTLAGINLDPAQPGFKHIIIRPRPVGDLTWARASHDCPYGTIRSNWRKEPGVLRLNVTVPVNTTATVYMPATDATGVTESGRPAASAPGVRLLRVENGCAAFEVGSGEYAFVSRAE